MKPTTDRHEASRGLSAIAGLLAGHAEDVKSIPFSRHSCINQSRSRGKPVLCVPYSRVSLLPVPAVLLGVLFAKKIIKVVLARHVYKHEYKRLLENSNHVGRDGQNF